MPVNLTVQLEAIPQDQFQKIDYAVMGCAFSIHNDLGRLLNESVYQEALKRSCEALSINCLREVKIVVSHKSFTKKYYLDLLVNNGTIYELKAVDALSPSHESQLLNYLLLCNLPFGKIINFRGKSVETRYVSTTLNTYQRKEFKIHTDDWKPQSIYCESIPTIISELISDLGTHLDLSLYNEALVHLIAPYQSLQKPVELSRESESIGHQNLNLLNGTTSLTVSSLRSGLQSYESQLHRLLSHTKLDSIQWINFGTHDIHCITIVK